MDGERGDDGVPSVIGRRLARLRALRGYRMPGDLARAAGVHKSVVSNLETGVRRGASNETYRALAAALGVTVDALTNPQEEAAPLPAYGQPAVPAEGLSPQDAAQLVDMVNEYIRTHRR